MWNHKSCVQWKAQTVKLVSTLYIQQRKSAGASWTMKTEEYFIEKKWDKSRRRKKSNYLSQGKMYVIKVTIQSQLNCARYIITFKIFKSVFEWSEWRRLEQKKNENKTDPFRQEHWAMRWFSELGCRWHFRSRTVVSWSIWFNTSIAMYWYLKLEKSRTFTSALCR